MNELFKDGTLIRINITFCADLCDLSRCLYGFQKKFFEVILFSLSLNKCSTYMVVWLYFSKKYCKGEMIYNLFAGKISLIFIFWPRYSAIDKNIYYTLFLNELNCTCLC